MGGTKNFLRVEKFQKKSAGLNSPRIYHKVATTGVPGASYKMFVQDAGRYGNLVYSALAAINMEMSGPASGWAKMLFFGHRRCVKALRASNASYGFP